jgi:hypothetical protein
MENLDGLIESSTKHNRTKILPLRWIGNICGNIAVEFLVHAVILDEDGNNGLRYNIYSKIWNVLNKPYSKWGTYYKINIKKIKG